MVKPPRSVLIRDAAVFFIKLWIDGFKDIVLAASAVGAVALDIFRNKDDQPYYFYRVVRAGRKFDHELDVYAPADNDLQPPSTPIGKYR